MLFNKIIFYCKINLILKFYISHKYKIYNQIIYYYHNIKLE